MPRAGYPNATPRPTGLAGASSIWLYSIGTFEKAPEARPAGFHHAPDASSATATKAPAMPCACTPTRSKLCADAVDAPLTSSTQSARRCAIGVVIVDYPTSTAAATTVVQIEALRRRRRRAADEQHT